MEIWGIKLNRRFLMTSNMLNSEFFCVWEASTIVWFSQGELSSVVFEMEGNNLLSSQDVVVAD